MGRVVVMTFDKMDLLLKSQELRQRLGEDVNSPTDIFALASAIERLTLVRYPMSEHLSGMCVKSGANCVIAINSKMSLGRQRFSLAHELFHLYYDENMMAICLAAMNTGNDIERAADTFAAFFLIPPASLKKKICEMRGKGVPQLGLREVIQLEQYFGVSHQAMLNQLVDIGEITPQQAADMKHGVIKFAEILGFSTDLYQRLPVEKQYQTNGYLIEQASSALSKNLISEGKYEEILLQAFRADLVFGEDEDGGEVID